MLGPFDRRFDDAARDTLAADQFRDHVDNRSTPLIVTASSCQAMPSTAISRLPFLSRALTATISTGRAPRHKGIRTIRAS